MFYEKTRKLKAEAGRSSGEATEREPRGGIKIEIMEAFQKRQ